MAWMPHKNEIWGGCFFTLQCALRGWPCLPLLPSPPVCWDSLSQKSDKTVLYRCFIHGHGVFIQCRVKMISCASTKLAPGTTWFHAMFWPTSKELCAWPTGGLCFPRVDYAILLLQQICVPHGGHETFTRAAVTSCAGFAYTW